MRHTCESTGLTPEQLAAFASMEAAPDGGEEEASAALADPPWVRQDEKGRFRLDCPVLADYIRQQYHYFFACGDARGLKELYLYRDGVYVLQSEDDFRGFIKSHIPRELYRGKDVEEVYKDLRTDPADGGHCVSIDALNADEDIVNFRNGLYHLSSRTLTPHDPQYLTTIQYALDYRPVEECENGGVFDRFLSHHLGGDPEQVRLMLEFMGVAISNIDASRMKKALFVIGEGNTGKSQVKNLLTRLLGREHCAPMELSDLEKRFGTSALYQKRLAGSNDMSCLRLEELINFKKLTGGDSIAAEFKGQPHFTFHFRGLLWFCANEPPLFGGDKGSWVYDRICMIKPTGVVYPKDTPPFDGIVYADPLLPDKLWEEREYIVSRALAALEGVIARGYCYGIAEQNKAYLAAYQTQNSSTLSFYYECCTPRPVKGKYDHCSRAMLYKVYLEWCKQNSRHGYYDRKQDFKKALESIDMGRICVVNGTRYYADFTLSLEAKREYVHVYGYESALGAG